MCGIAFYLEGARVQNIPSWFHENTSTAINHPTHFIQKSSDFVSSSSSSSSVPSNVSVFVSGSDSSPSQRFLAALRQQIESRGPDHIGQTTIYPFTPSQIHSGAPSLHFLASTLFLRGNSTMQPLQDAYGNILLFNGEIFESQSPDWDPKQNDTTWLLQYLHRFFDSQHTNSSTDSSHHMRFNLTAALDSHLEGPWAIIYWQQSANRLWFGRDAIGRRSLVIDFLGPSQCAVSSCLNTHSQVEIPPIGMLFIDFAPSIQSDCPTLHQQCQQHDSFSATFGLNPRSCSPWNPLAIRTPPGAPKGSQLANCFLPQGMTRASALREAVSSASIREAQSTKSNIIAAAATTSTESIDETQSAKDSIAALFIQHLKSSVSKRLEALGSKASSTDCPLSDSVNIALLFSGGVDSVILARLIDVVLNEKLDHSSQVDLINVAFHFNGSYETPDRQSALKAFYELDSISISHRFRLLLVDVDPHDLELNRPRVLHKIYPCNTPMDASIGGALWFASRGKGTLMLPDLSTRQSYTTKSRVIFSGLGADELLAGYKRHRNIYTRRNYESLLAELDADLARLWWRNLGRDDRIVSDHGREMRYPFLDESFITFICSVPPNFIFDLALPDGVGDKWILRQAMPVLGFSIERSRVIKRAMQFGSRSKQVLEAKVDRIKDKNSEKSSYHPFRISFSIHRFVNGKLDGCDQKFDVSYAIKCNLGGFVIRRHDPTRDLIGRLFRERGLKVTTKPHIKDTPWEDEKAM